MTTVCAYIVYLAAAAIAAGVFVYGDLITAAVTLICSALLCVPTILLIRKRADERINDLALGNRNASTNFFVERLRQIEYDHVTKVQAISLDLGSAAARLQDAERKIARMTTRPKAGGRFIKADEPQTPLLEQQS
jgi:hypothetical protein